MKKLNPAKPIDTTIKVHENFFDVVKFTRLQKFILSYNFDITFAPGTSYFPQMKKQWEENKWQETPQMCRTIFYRKGITGIGEDGEPHNFNQMVLIHDYYWKIPHLHELVLNMSNLDIYRMKVNLLMPYPNAPEYHVPHQDVAWGERGREYKSFLYYLNDSDGDTFFFDDQNNIIQRQTPKANTMIEFNSRILHASSNPTQGPRYVLNTVMSDSLLGLD